MSVFVVDARPKDTYWVCCESAGGLPGCKLVTGWLDVNYECENDMLGGRVKKGQYEYEIEKTLKSAGASHEVSVHVAACGDNNTFQIHKVEPDGIVYQCDRGYEALTFRFDEYYHY